MTFIFWGLVTSWFTPSRPNVNINTQKPEKCHLFHGDYKGNKTEEMFYTAITYAEKATKLSISHADYMDNFCNCLEPIKRAIVKEIINKKP